MNSILINSGRIHWLDGDLVESDRNVPTVQEIAHALAQINRFTGHCRRPYSVAEHTLLVADIVRATSGSVVAEFCALLHDAHESTTGDAASPIKRVLGEAWERFEDRQQRLVVDGYGMLGEFERHRAMVKLADLIALATERRDLMPWSKGAGMRWEVLDRQGHEVDPWMGVNLASWSRRLTPWWVWRDRLVRRFRVVSDGAAEVLGG